MKITRLRARRFRGFHADFVLDLPDGRNLLLYGDNGSGKSSLACALKHFLVDKAAAITPHRNVFSAQGEDAEVEITYTPWPDHGATLRWDTAGHPLHVPLNRLTDETRPVFRDAVVRASFIDYRDLLRTSGRRDLLPHEFFELVVDKLLCSVEVTVAGGASTLGTVYDNVRGFPTTLRKEERIALANSKAQAFNGAFQGLLGPLETKTRDLLVHFEGLCATVRFEYAPLRWDEQTGWKQGGTLRPIVTFKNAELDHCPEVLNEARLTALATCIFLAGALISDVDAENPDHPRLLVLDDALISLDASNRKPVLDILQLPAFRHFQIILLTHDSVWFDVARKRLNGWKVCKLVSEYPDRPAEASVSILQDMGGGGPTSDLDVAENHLNHGDKPAAAVYARSAFERKLKTMAEENKLKIAFQKEVRRVTADNLWTAVKAWNAGLAAPHIPVATVTAIEACRSDVLNELSHTEPRNWDTPTIRAALVTLRQFAGLPNCP
jgi:energy-coupling factor transporter ATP-binding protein EcfA2